MTVLAKDAEPGKIYRLTRDSGTTYYKICDDPARKRLEKRLGSQNQKLMSAEDRFAFQALLKSRLERHVLAMRVQRFRTKTGEPKETKAYVAFPPDYVLREVEKPPGYTSGRKPAGSPPD
jgi:hypothetical protein